MQHCSDSTFFIYSNATELNQVYTDSLQSEFDSRYRASCLEAYKMETFTVSHQASEYHYTLYYYDQAGNLIKTIPPKGVNPNRNATWLDEIKVKRAAGEIQTPSHTMATQYRYNTLNQVVAQQSPDAGKTEFWYDRLGRLALSGNAKQKAVSESAANRLYSYTKYDYLGRITEVGQIKDNTGSVTVSEALTRNPSVLGAWLADRDPYRGQITSTVYDLPYGGFAGFDSRLVVQQRNLRNRVSFTSYADTVNGTAFNQATYYSYDIHGNVDTLLQDYGVTGQYPNLMNKNGNRFKKVVYGYDLISGKVNKVSYQPGWSDQVFHQYSYDAENRLTAVETSFDGRRWEREAAYEYYRHGPLARMVLGHQQVQGIDYAYTLQGWLKGVNSTQLFTTTDIGEDGLSGGINQLTARDATGFTLNYYDTADYSAIGGGNPFPGTMAYMPPGQYRPLFNGNISSMAINNRSLNQPGNVGGALMLYNYRYDQLNRLTQMNAYKNLNTATNTWSGLTGMNQFKEFIGYDGNGNILQYKRHAHKGAYIMDSLSYSYYAGTNRLSWVKDPIPSARYSTAAGDVADIDNQAVNNYGYDEIGNLVKDTREGITAIKWSVYGKILEITRNADASNAVQKISYTYDGQGNRISKTVLKNTGNKTHTWYVRDAQGNVLTTYTSQGNPSDETALPLHLSERHLYGSSRLGMYSKTLDVDNGPKDMSDTNSVQYYRGYRQYELSNHLGNVLATITDKKKGVDTNSDGQINYYDADVTSAQDYYPFGMLMSGRIGYKADSGWVSAPGSGAAGSDALAADIGIDTRTDNVPPEYTATNSVELNPGFESGTGDAFSAYISEDDGGSGGGSGSSLSGSYRYGFNGKENDNEVKGTGNQQDYGMRIYDNRLGRFLSVDPLTKSFSMLTPYQFASNRPIEGIDLDGEEFLSFHKSMYRMEYRVSSTSANTIVKAIYENIPAAIQNPENKSFKYVSGGPVTDMGRDYTPAELSGLLYTSDKYFKNGPKFYGLADGGQDPEPTGSTSGMGGAAVNQARNNAANGAAGALGEEGVGVLANVYNAFVSNKWGALSDEVKLRQGFYNATNLVNYQVKNNQIGNEALTKGTGKAALINFISDGYLPTDQGNNFSLQVAYEGVQQMNLANIDIQDKTKESIQTLLNNYKKEGGDNRYDKINTFLNQRKK